VTRNLLLSGGPGHDFAATTAAMVDLFDDGGLPTTVVDDPVDAVELLAADRNDIAVLTVNALCWSMRQPAYAAERSRYAATLDTAQLAVLAEFVRGGGGLLALHTAVICFDGAPQWRALCGATWRWGTSSHPPYGTTRVRVTEAGRRHELTNGLDDIDLEDEVYGFLDEVDDLEPLLSAEHGGRDHPLLWARTVGRGRVVTDLLGHDAASITHQAHRTVLARAVRWVSGLPVHTEGSDTGAGDG
jgi:uncharacterized protein